jgi:hypothetical protein
MVARVAGRAAGSMAAHARNRAGRTLEPVRCERAACPPSVSFRIGKNQGQTPHCRRVAPFMALIEVKRGTFTSDHPVPYHILSGDAQAGEISLAENTVRPPMHPGHSSSIGDPVSTGRDRAATPRSPDSHPSVLRHTRRPVTSNNSIFPCRPFIPYNYPSCPFISVP